MGVGELTNRLNNDLEKIISLLKKIIDLSSRLITALVILIYSFCISIIVGIEFIVLGIFMYILANIYYPKIKKVQEEISIEYLFNNIQYSLVYNPSNYESNKQILNDSLGENNCSLNNDYYCQISNGVKGGYANSNGDIAIWINNFSCSINQYKTQCYLE